MFRISSMAVGFVLVTYPFSVYDVEARADEGSRVTHFALLSTGPAFDEDLEMLLNEVVMICGESTAGHHSRTSGRRADTLRE